MEQSERLIHGMGDVHPPALKLLLLERLSRLAPWEETRTVLGSSGSEAMEVALKTSELSTGRSGIIAFEGAYHGLTLGSLAVTARPDFRDPFRARLHQGVSFAPYPETEDEAEVALAEVQRLLSEGVRLGGGQRAEPSQPVGAVVVEPVQGRAGVRIPPPGFLGRLAELTHVLDRSSSSMKSSRGSVAPVSCSSTNARGSFRISYASERRSVGGSLERLPRIP